jgi:hypothetical protein
MYYEMMKKKQYVTNERRIYMTDLRKVSQHGSSICESPLHVDANIERLESTGQVQAITKETLSTEQESADWLEEVLCDMGTGVLAFSSAS